VLDEVCGFLSPPSRSQRFDVELVFVHASGMSEDGCPTVAAAGDREVPNGEVIE
jgi:hypothetical protein